MGNLSRTTRARRITALATLVATPVIAGAVMAATAAPAHAADLLNSDVQSKQDIKNPLKDLNAEVVVAALGKVADKLKI
jgi:hypothetical protein